MQIRNNYVGRDAANVSALIGFWLWTRDTQRRTARSELSPHLSAQMKMVEIGRVNGDVAIPLSLSRRVTPRT